MTPGAPASPPPRARACLRAVWRAALLLAVVTGAACVEPCARAEAIADRYRSAHAACFPEPLSPRQRLDRKACEASLRPCSAADLAALDAYFDCVERLPACAPETKDAWTTSLLECTAGMTTLSAGCFAP